METPPLLPTFLDMITYKEESNSQPILNDILRNTNSSITKEHPKNQTSSMSYDSHEIGNTYTVDSEQHDKVFLNHLEQKGELAVFMGKSNTPCDYISFKTFKFIIKLLGEDIRKGYVYASFGMYTEEIIWNFKHSVKEKGTGKPNDYIFELKKEWESVMETTQKMKTPMMCFDNLGIIDEQLQKMKLKEQDINENKDDENINNVNDNGNEEELIQEKVDINDNNDSVNDNAEDENENENERPELLINKITFNDNDNNKDNIISHEAEILSESKGNEEPEHNDNENSNDNDNDSNYKELEPKRLSSIDKEIIIKPSQHQTQNPSNPLPPQQQSPLITTESPITTEIPSPSLTKALSNKNEETTQDINDDTIESLDINISSSSPKHPQTHIDTKHKLVHDDNQVTGSTQTFNPEKQQQPKKKVIKKIIRKKPNTTSKKSANTTNTPKKHTTPFNVTNTKSTDMCVICKGIPVRPQECIICRHRYCKLCTNDLDNPLNCRDCNGTLVPLKNDNINKVQIYEANITRFITKPKDEVSQTQKQFNEMSTKDFYVFNKDRYVDDVWKENYKKEEEENNKKYASNSSSQKQSKRIKKDNNNNNNNSNNIFTYNKASDDKIKIIEHYCKDIINEKKITVNPNDQVWSIIYIPCYNNAKDAIAMGHTSGCVSIWDIDKGEKLKSFHEHTSKVYFIKLLEPSSNDNNNNNTRAYLVSVSEDKTIKIWNMQLQNSILSIPNISPLYSLDIINNKCIVVGDKNRNLTIYHIDLSPTSESNCNYMISMSTSHKGFIWRVLNLKKVSSTTCIVSSSEGVLQLHQFANNELKQLDFVHSYEHTHEGLIHDIEEMSQGNFATCGVDHVIKIWNYMTKEAICVIDMLYNDVIYDMIYLNKYDEVCDGTGDDVLVVGGSDKRMKVIGKGKDSKDVKIYGEYVRKEGLYKMRLITNNKKFKYVGINYGNSSNVYLWGKKEEE